MKGVKSECSICGAIGYKFGCPSFFDVCQDKEACRDRAIQNKEKEIKELKEKVEKLERNTGSN